MTAEQTRRVIESINECDRFIAKMEKLNFEWLSDDEKKMLANAKIHKATLQNMIGN